MGERIRTCRESIGMTQEELAETCEVSRVYITQIEQGLKVPTVALLKTIADALNTSMDELCGRKGENHEDRNTHH